MARLLRDLIRRLLSPVAAAILILAVASTSANAAFFNLLRRQMLRADLSVDSFVLDRRQASSGETIQATVTISNMASVAATATVLKVSTGSTPTSSAAQLASAQLGTLPPRSSLTHVSTFQVPNWSQTGTYQILASVETPAESNWQDNTRSTTLEFVVAPSIGSGSSAGSGSSSSSDPSASTTPTSSDTTSSTGGTTSSTGGTTTSTDGTTSSTDGSTTASTGSTTSLEPTPTYIEKLGFQVVATDGSCASPTYLTWPGPEASADKIFIAYMYDPNGCGASGANHNIKIGAYDYVTGTWTLTPGLLGSSFYTYCCDGHDTPSIYRNPVTGLLDVVYGAISSGGNCGPSDAQGPYYNTSATANGQQWSPRQRIPAFFTAGEMTGDYDSNGTLHLQGSQQCGPGGTRGAERNYYRRSPNGTWTTTQGLIRVTHNGSQLHRGEPHPAYLSVGGSTLHLVWQRLVNNYGNARDLFYARSTDGGTTWCSANGASCFSTSSPLTGAWDAASALHDYPANYRVAQFSRGGMASVGALANGTPVAAAATDGGTMFYRFVGGTTWSATTIDGSGTEISRIITTSTGKILMYGGDHFTMKEYASTDSGTSFTTTVLRAKGAEVSNRWAQARRFAKLGGKERVIVQWVQDTGSFYNVVVMDRPQE